jgi:hypothetical protein
MRTKKLGSDANGGILDRWRGRGRCPLPGGHMKNGISSVSRRVVLVAVALVLVTAAGDRPAYAVESKDVNVVNTPTVNARQSGAWDVGIDRVPEVVGDLDSGWVSRGLRRICGACRPPSDHRAGDGPCGTITYGSGCSFLLHGNQRRGRVRLALLPCHVLGAKRDLRGVPAGAPLR